MPAKVTENEPEKNEDDDQKGAPNESEQEESKSEQDGDRGQLTDKHGEQAVNRGRYDRDMRAKQSEIDELKKQLEEANGRADAGAQALKAVKELEARLADERLTHRLDSEGCVNAKAAKAILGDYDGDVAKLKEAAPYLFGANDPARQQGSTGARSAGAAKDDKDEALDRAFGLVR